MRTFFRTIPEFFEYTYNMVKDSEKHNKMLKKAIKEVYRAYLIDNNIKQ